MRVVGVRLLVVAGLWVSVTMLGAPAGAHHSVTFTDCDDPNTTPEPTTSPAAPDPPTPEPTASPEPMACTPESGSVLRETVTLAFEVTADSLRPISQVDVYILSEDGGVPSPKNGGPIKTYSFSEEDAVEGRAFTIVWDTRLQTPYNGSYTVRVTANTHNHAADGEGVASAERLDLRVDNPPVRPKPPRATEFSTEALALEWEPAIEDDIVSYTLYRAAVPPEDLDSSEVPESSFQPVRTTTNTLTIDDPPPGVYRYAVQSVRRSVVDPELGIGSTLSLPSTLVRIPTDQAERPQVTSTQPTLPGPVPQAAPPPDDTYSRYLPYGLPEGSSSGGPAEERPAEPSDLRMRLTPVAIGMLLLSAALAAFRMPF